MDHRERIQADQEFPCPHNVDEPRVPVLQLPVCLHLYNVWRLTDVLVKLELDAEAEFADKPLVTADLFLTIAKDFRILGLDPPD